MPGTLIQVMTADEALGLAMLVIRKTEFGSSGFVPALSSAALVTPSLSSSALGSSSLIDELERLEPLTFVESFGFTACTLTEIKSPNVPLTLQLVTDVVAVVTTPLRLIVTMYDEGTKPPGSFSDQVNVAEFPMAYG